MYETHEASNLVFVVQWAVHGDGGGRRETRYTGRKAVFLQLVLVQAAPAMTAAIKDAIRDSMERLGKRMTIRNMRNWGTFRNVQCAMSNAMNQGQSLDAARKRVISQTTISEELARYLMHALKCLQTGSF